MPREYQENTGTVTNQPTLCSGSGRDAMLLCSSDVSVYVYIV